MKKLRKVFAVILSLAMVMGMSMTAFATDKHSSEQAVVEGIETEEGATITVKAYQIIKYNDKGYYEPVIPNTISKAKDKEGNDVVVTTVGGETIYQLNPTASDVEALFGRVNELSSQITFTKNADGNYVYSKDATPAMTAGTWMVVVYGSNKYVYSPAIISVDQTPEGLSYGELNLTTDSWGGDAYLKKSEPTITKKAESAETAEGTAAGDPSVVGTQFGDILKFTVTTQIPSYMPNKTNITYDITDTLNGLKLVVNDKYKPSATVGGQENATLTAAVNTAIQNDAESFKVTGLGDEFLTTHPSQTIEIVYYAKVTSTTMINVDRLNNTAELDYSTNVDTNTKHKEAETKHYTFGIDVPISGIEGEQTKTGEFIKTHDEHDDVNIEYSETLGEIIYKESDVSALAGAEFQLHVGAVDGPVFTDKSGKNTFTTTNDGRLAIAGLDDNKDYYLIETKAPRGYALNATPVKVHITATYEKNPVSGLDDILESYVVNIGEALTHYNYDVKEGETTFINTEETASNPYEFKNSTLNGLPSTGGIGTTIFTIGGCIIMVVAAGLFFASRRKSAK